MAYGRPSLPVEQPIKFELRDSFWFVPKLCLTRAHSSASQRTPDHSSITGRGGLDPHLFSAGFRTVLWVAATPAAAGGALSYLTIRDDSVAAGLPPPRRLVPLAI